MSETTDTHHIVLSYAREDGLPMKRLAEAIEQDVPVNVWYDLDIAVGTPSYVIAINEAICAAGMVITLWSRHSIQSDWVIGETLRASEQGKAIGVVVDAQVDIPAPFNANDTFDLSSWQDLELGSPLLTPLKNTLRKRFPNAGPDKRQRKWQGSSVLPRFYFETVLPSGARHAKIPDALEGKTLLFLVTGLGGGRWALTVTDGELQVVSGFMGKADLTIKPNSAAMAQTLEGKTDLLQAIARGQAEMNGDVTILEHVHGMFRQSRRPPGASAVGARGSEDGSALDAGAGQARAGTPTPDSSITDTTEDPRPADGREACEATNRAHHVIVIYAGDDEQYARRLVEAIGAVLPLEVRACSASSIGIDDAIRRARVVLTVWSRSSVKESWVVDLTARASRQNKSFGVITGESVEAPTPFNMSQSLDLSAWRDLRPDSPILKPLRELLRERFADIAEAEEERERREREHKRRQVGEEAKRYFETEVPGFAKDKTMPAEIEGTTLVYLVTGINGGRWALTVKDRRLHVIPGFEGGGDLRVKVTSCEFLSMLRGTFNARQALLEGNVELRGDHDLLKPYGRVLSGIARRDDVVE